MKLTTIVLAGGNSSRMGQDKGLMPLAGRAMITYVFDGLKAVSDNILIVSNNDAYHEFGYPVFKDEYVNKGPLAGIYTGLINSDSQVNAVVSCDVPFISGALLSYLKVKSVGYDITIPRHPGGTEQLMGIYSRNCIPIFKNEIEANRLKIKSANQKTRYQEVPIDKELSFYNSKMFMNVNSPEDFRKAQIL